ncbi:MAG: cobalamin biosynthesis protein [Candidatus Bathyarchaeota archaeon]|nr:cobalamin biosynthesis protein [Candidatus Bathyarchaeota archaeon]
MLVIESGFFVDSLLIFVLAFLIDVVFGEFPDRVHPTVGIGKAIAYFKPIFKNANPRIEKANGIIFCVLIIVLVTVPIGLLLFGIRHFLGWIPYIVVSAILFKTTFAIKCMRQYTGSIAGALKSGDLDKARRWLRYVVRRDPANLNEQQIASAAIESIGESTTDGITSPFFFFALFGVPGAFAFRVVNTLDSMVGYKDREHVNIGWFSAKLDTIANYVPTRFTAVLMVVAAALLGERWRESWRILQRDKAKTSSVNAGWTMSAMAGALGVQLEKPGHYALGDKGNISPEHIRRALRIMDLTAVLFGAVVVCPILAAEALVLWLV